ncbi:MAG: hypothetical protein K0Q91_1162 [Fibrobacteria bacterium]|jgi:opacity protein-like surface antigen|nr:hypothetical protein [Fibrobacteria bacterium]
MLRFHILLSVALAGSAFAQDSTRASVTPAPSVSPGVGASRMGFGVSVGPATVLLAGPDGSYPSEQVMSAFYFSVSGPRFKFEPEFAVNRLSASVDADGYNFEQTYMALRFGVGLLGVSKADKLGLYYGGRLGVILESASYEVNDEVFGESDSDSEERTNFYVGPVLGAEYFIADNFSVGAEGQLIFTFTGDYTSGDEESGTYETGYETIDSRALFFLRWYY